MVDIEDPFKLLNPFFNGSLTALFSITKIHDYDRLLSIKACNPKT